MATKISSSLAGIAGLLALTLALGEGVTAAPAPGDGAPPRDAGGPAAADRAGRGGGGPGFFGGFGGFGFGPGGFRPVSGEVVDVRGNVLQLQTPDRDGLTRVILAADAQIVRDETLKVDALKPGMRVSGNGRQVDGTGTGLVPLKVEVQSLQIADSGTGGPGGRFGFGGFFGFRGRGGPLMRGRPADVFRKQNYAGTISFSAQVKSADPLVLVDDQSNPLPVVLGEDVEVHQRVSQPIREGDIIAGTRVLATGETTPDGLLNAHTITVMGEGGQASGPGALSGIITAVSDQSVTVRPRFAPDDLRITLDPAAKLYVQERLDLHSIQVGDTLTFTGKLIRGTAAAPKALVVRTITPADQDVPPVEEERRGPFGGRFGGFGGGFGGRSVTTTVTGKITSLDPVQVQTADGRTVEIKVPGQIAYVRYRPLERADLKAGQKVLFSGRSRENGFIAERVVVNPSLATGPGF